VSRFNTRVAIILAYDLSMAVFAWLLSWCARFNFSFNFPDWHLSFYGLSTVVITQGIIFWIISLHRGSWRFASLPDLWKIIRSAVIGAFSITIILFFMIRLEGIPRSILILYPVFLIILLGGSRFSYRLWKDNPFNKIAVLSGEKVLIVGAGRAGEMLVRDMLRNDNYTPIGFLDDNPRLEKSELHGVSIIGSVDILPEVVKENEIDIIVIAVPSATNEQMQRIVKYCEQTSVPIRTLPNLRNIESDKYVESQLHDLSIDDLLGREKFELDLDFIQSGIINRVVMITGGGGSIGSELCSQISGLGPNTLIIYERNELNLYKIQSTLTQKYPNIKLYAILGDISDTAKVNHIFAEYKPDIVFHTVAYNQVPVLQEQCREVVRNNILGTKNIAEIANENQCDKFVFISADKAVNSVNVNGISKRIAEIYCEGVNQYSTTKFITVRYGNVLDSDESVIPLFREQIQQGGPVLVTHPDSTRYFMTISEVCQLIIQASSMGQGGEIFVLDMGQPIKISYFVEQMIRLSGAIPGQDINIEFTGLGPDEMIDEELFYKNEKQEKTDHAKILLAKHHPVNWQILVDDMSELENACNEFNDEKIISILEKHAPNNIH